MPRRPKYITDPETFNKEFERIVAFKKELEATRREAQTLIDQLNSNTELPAKVQEQLAKLVAELERLESLYNQTTTYIQGIEAYHNSFSEIKKSIDQELTAAGDQNKTLKSYIEETENLKEELGNELGRSKALLDDARKTLTLVTDGALSTVFNERSTDRRKSRRWWTFGVLLTFIVFVFGVYFAVEKVAPEFNGAGNITAWILKLVVISPFAYILYFVTRQYNHERDLEEKYAFKALISQTINNNTKLLKDEFLVDNDQDTTQVKEKIVDFTIESLRAVYREPFRESSLKSKLKFNPRKTDVSAEIEQGEKL